MEQISIKWSPRQIKDIYENYTGGFSYSWVSENNEQVSKFFTCRDHVLKCFLVSYLQKNWETYYKIGDAKIDSKNIRILIRDKENDLFESMMPNLLDFLNQFEDKMGVEKSVIYKVKASDNCFLLLGSKEWLLSPPLVSLYTLLLRVGPLHKIGDDFRTTLAMSSNGKVYSARANDYSFMKQSLNRITSLLEKGYKSFFCLKMEDNYELSEQDLASRYSALGFATYTEIYENTRAYPDSYKDYLKVTDKWVIEKN